MFQTAVLQITVDYSMGEYQLLPLDQEPLFSLLAERINREIGGKVYGQQLIRTGANYIQVKKTDMPEAVGASILFTVHFEASTFYPLCGANDVEYTVIVTERNPESKELVAEYLDPETHHKLMEVIVDCASFSDPTLLPQIHSTIRITLQAFEFEQDQTVVKCLGTAGPGPSGSLNKTQPRDVIQA
jgi:hypothetical protein